MKVAETDKVLALATAALEAALVADPPTLTLADIDTVFELRTESGWTFIIFDDAGQADYVEQAFSDDGHSITFDQIADAGLIEPIDQLSPAAYAMLQQLAEAAS